MYAEQRSQEWFSLRENLVTASDIASILGISRFETREDVMYKKCGFVKKYSEKSLSAMSHGTHYESIARDLYCAQTGEIVHEIGIVVHPDYPFLGASADGITNSGKLIEIKCPTGELRSKIPDYYYPQVQICMEVLDLNTCDYIEFKVPDIIKIHTVERDKDWFRDNIQSIEDFWTEVKDRRTRPLCEIIETDTP
jgi:putative phage-type endonuclease